ncbi:hypothetical protein SARC_12507, partial [Sphaeroforma arctica JP610]
MVLCVTIYKNHQSPATQLRERAESIVLEDNEEEPFKVVREFEDYAFMSIVGWHLFELIGSRASAGEDRDTDPLYPYSLVTGDRVGSVATTRNTTAAAAAAAAAGAAGDSRKELGQQLFEAMKDFVLAQRESARGSHSYLNTIGRYDNIRVGLAKMTSRHNNSKHAITFTKIQISLLVRFALAVIRLVHR